MTNAIRVLFHRESSQTNSSSVPVRQTTQAPVPPTAVPVRQANAAQTVLTSVPPVHARPTALPVATVPTNPPVVPRPALTSVPPVHTRPTNLHVVTVPRNPPMTPRPTAAAVQPRRIEMHTMSEQEVQQIQKDVEFMFAMKEIAATLLCNIFFPTSTFPSQNLHAIFEKYKLDHTIVNVVNKPEDRPDLDAGFLIKKVGLLVEFQRNYPQVKICNFTRCVFSNYDDLRLLRGIITGAVFSKHMKPEHFEKCKAALGPDIQVAQTH